MCGTVFFPSNWKDRRHEQSKRQQHSPTSGSRGRYKVSTHGKGGTTYAANAAVGVDKSRLEIEATLVRHRIRGSYPIKRAVCLMSTQAYRALAPWIQLPPANATRSSGFGWLCTCGARDDGFGSLEAALDCGEYHERTASAAEVDA